MGKANRAATLGNPLGNPLGAPADVDDGTVLRELLARGSSCLPAKVRDALVLLAPPTCGLDEPPVWQEQASSGQASSGQASGGQASGGAGSGGAGSGGRRAGSAGWRVGVRSRMRVGL